jgi:hypothetical protein
MMLYCICIFFCNFSIIIKYRLANLFTFLHADQELLLRESTDAVAAYDVFVDTVKRVCKFRLCVLQTNRA